jgi:putative SOS response-associated peptidase YedK
MCGRFTRTADQKTIAQRFGVAKTTGEETASTPRYNIAPTQAVIVVNDDDPQLSNIDAILTDISPVVFDGDRAEYQMIRMDNGIRISHFILFVKDADGIWRLEFF